MDQMYIHKSENTLIYQPAAIKSKNSLLTRSSAMDLLKENKQLKSMLLLHLNVISEQSDMLVAKDKQIAALQAKIERLERAGLAPDENECERVNNSPQPAQSFTGNTGLKNLRLSLQPLSRGSIMKMAALNASGGKSQFRARPLINPKNVVIPATPPPPPPTTNIELPVVSFQQHQQIELPNSIANGVVKEEQNEINRSAELVQSLRKNLVERPAMTVTKSVVANEEHGTRWESGVIYASDGSPNDMVIELKLDEDDDDYAGHMEVEVGEPKKEEEEMVDTSPSKSDLQPQSAVNEVVIKKESPKETTTTTSVRPSGSPPRVDPPRLQNIVVIATQKRNASACSNQAPRKYSRVMSTRKQYVSRHWEEEDVDEPNSLVVPELKGENLEVPNWREIDGRGLDEEIRGEDVLQSVVATEDLSEAAFLKRHSKHEADERRRKKWDIQRFREQRTIEKLKKRHCKSDMYYSTGVGGKFSAPVSEEQANMTYPMSLFPGLNNIRHVETTEYLPVQAFGEPIPTLGEGEFQLPWNATTAGGVSVEWLGAQGNGGPAVGASGSQGAGADNSNNNSFSSKYSTFYVKQNSSQVPAASRYPTNNISSNRFRFKRIKSQSGKR